MKKIFLVLFCLPSFMGAEVYLRNGLSFGRFGDNLLSYIHTRYLAYKYNLKIDFQNFVYADQLFISKREKNRVTTIQTRATKRGFDKLCTFLRVESPHYKPDISVEIPYFPEDASEHTPTSEHIFFEIPRQDQDFKNHLRKFIAPIRELELLHLPEDRITVALHLRLGGSYSDDWVNRQKIPLKLPPLSFFVTGLEKVLALFDVQQKFYVHIFTDEDDTLYYLNYFKERFPQENIIFNARLEGNKHDQNVLEDFFSMIQFDCLIHPLSNFSICAAKLADYLIEIEPLKFEKVGTEFVITEDRVTCAGRLKASTEC